LMEQQWPTFQIFGKTSWSVLRVCLPAWSNQRHCFHRTMNVSLTKCEWHWPRLSVQNLRQSEAEIMDFMKYLIQLSSDSIFLTYWFCSWYHFIAFVEMSARISCFPDLYWSIVAFGVEAACSLASPYLHEWVWQFRPIITSLPPVGVQ
jgi:hypothetical protein